MRAMQIIDSVIRHNHIRKSDVARRKGCTPMALNSYFANSNPTEDVLVSVAGLIGYKVVLMPLDHALEADEYEVTHGGK